MLGVGFIENPRAVGELCQVQFAAVIHLEEHRTVGGEGHIPGLRANPWQDLCCRDHQARKRLSLGYQGPDDRPFCVGMGRVEARFHAGSTYDAADEPCLELDCAEHVALPPEIVGRIFAGRDLRHRSVDDGAGWPNEHKRANRSQTRPEQPCEPGIAIEAALDHVPRAAGEIDG